MLSIHSRQDQMFLVDSRKATFPSLACCSISAPLQYETAKTFQQQTQHKKSLKMLQKRRKRNPRETSVVELQATLPKNLKRRTLDVNLSDSDHTNHQLGINRIQSQQISLNTASQNPKYHNIPYPFVSLQNIQSFPSLTFTYSEPRLQIYQQTNTELVYVKEIENVQQTTCLEFQSQESASHYFGKPERVINTPFGKKLESEEEPKPQKQGEEWSDESLSSETKVRFQQIEEEQSISDSYSVHHKNKVTVIHNHSPTFQQFRKTHSIRSKFSDSSSHFSGHSIVLEKQHNFLTPHKHRYFYNDY